MSRAEPVGPGGAPGGTGAAWPAPEALDRPLPERVRARVIALAADALGALPEEEVPSTLRAFRRFTPTRRARLAAAPIAAALEADPAFRQRVAARVREASPELGAALDSGHLLATAEPLDVAAAAYLLRPAGWVDRVRAAVEELARLASAHSTAQAAEALPRLQEQLTAVRSQARADLDRMREELQLARTESATLRQRLRETQEVVRRAEVATRQAEASAEAVRAAAEGAASLAEAELRRLRGRLAAAEAALETARRSLREGRSVTDVRLRLLLDTVVDAAQGLRRELALPPADVRPADLVDGVRPDPSGVGDVAVRALDSDDPALLDQLLGLPQAHLVVDGYNVTKTGYGGLPLEAQRQRLLAGLASLAARSRAEVTVCFDGAELAGPVALNPPRGVRVLFSRNGEIADELIRRLVLSEPPGRPVVVVSSDREVAEGVTAAGARALPATALLRRLERS